MRKRMIVSLLDRILWVEGWSRKLEGVLHIFLNADRFPIAVNAVHTNGYLFEFLGWVH